MFQAEGRAQLKILREDGVWHFLGAERRWCGLKRVNIERVKDRGLAGDRTSQEQTLYCFRAYVRNFKFYFSYSGKPLEETGREWHNLIYFLRTPLDLFIVLCRYKYINKLVLILHNIIFRY